MLHMYMSLCYIHLYKNILNGCKGGPVILDSMEFIPQQFQSGSCTASQWTEDTSFCRTNPTQCAQDREECYRLIDSNGTAVNHHCNAAMAFTIITGKRN